MARRNRTMPPRHPQAATLAFTKTNASGTSSADTTSYRYVIRRAHDSRWELRIYQMDTDSGARVPEPFASHTVTRDSRAECTAIAQAFHNLGDSYNEFGHGYRSRFDQALAEAVSGPAERARPAPPTSVRTPISRSDAAPAVTQTSASANSAVAGAKQLAGDPQATSRNTGPATPEERTPRQRRTQSPPGLVGGKSHGPGPSAAPNPSRRRAAAHLLTRRVFVETGAGRVHALPNCRASKPIHHWCTAEEAHYSRLTVCRACGKDLARVLRTVLGSIPDGERQQLPLPPLHGFGTRAERQRAKSQRNSRVRNNRRTVDRDAQSGLRSDDLPYGSPGRPDDPRFSHRSRMEWGTSSYRQHPDEFLGSPTDDDNDWRGGQALYE